MTYLGSRCFQAIATGIGVNKFEASKNCSWFGSNIYAKMSTNRVCPYFLWFVCH